jgi:hypothetical protein
MAFTALLESQAFPERECLLLKFLLLEEVSLSLPSLLVKVIEFLRRGRDDSGMLCLGDGGESLLLILVASSERVVCSKVSELRRGGGSLRPGAVCEEMELLRGRLRCGLVGSDENVSQSASLALFELSICCDSASSVGLFLLLGIFG